MKNVKTDKSDVTLTLSGGTEENNLHAQRVFVYDTSIGETKEDARLAFESIWMPDEDDARALEAGAGICLRVWAIRDDAGNHTSPPVSVSVTDAVVPEREIILRDHVDRALGHLYGALIEGADADIYPDPGEFADLWAEAVNATRPAEKGGAGDPDDPADVETAKTAGGDLDAIDFAAALAEIVGTGANIDSMAPNPGDPEWIILKITNVAGLARDTAVTAQGRTRRDLVARIRKAVEEAAVEAEHTQKETDPDA